MLLLLELNTIRLILRVNIKSRQLVQGAESTN